MTLSIVTPWSRHPEFIPGYEFAAKAPDTEAIIYDTHTDSPGEDDDLLRLCNRIGGLYRRWRLPYSFAGICNAGLKVAHGDIIVMLNNDVRPTDAATRLHWTHYVKEDVKPGAFYGPQLMQQPVDGLAIPFLSGWCIAAHRETWEAVGGFDSDRYPGGYWEDTDLCFRAVMQGIRLVKTDWPIEHINGGNGTSGLHNRETPETLHNKAQFHERVRQVMAGFIGAREEVRA